MSPIKLVRRCATIAHASIRKLSSSINGGDGTVQAALTELYNRGEYFGGNPPPVAVLPNGKTNLIALDLGAADGDALKALQRVIDLAACTISTRMSIERAS